MRRVRVVDAAPPAAAVRVTERGPVRERGVDLDLRRLRVFNQVVLLDSHGRVGVLALGTRVGTRVVVVYDLRLALRPGVRVRRGS